jgi:hypothetical protein
VASVSNVPKYVMDVVKVDLDVVYIVMAIHICYEYLFKMSHPL